ncbi:MAG: hypothetical protein ACLGQX_06225 [Acidobacteriota bacterium]
MQSIITSQWKQPHATGEFSTGVSLHSHTSVSEETLGFIHALVTALPGLKRVFEFYRRRSERYGIVLDYARANWRPPLQPRMAYDVESRQVQRLGLNPLVSITDHDSIEAPMLLRTIPSSRHIPVSLEWSAPFGKTVFHLGIHNLPSRSGVEWMLRFQRYTAEAQAVARAADNPEEMDARLLSMLRELQESPQTLIVFNHPLWDLHKVGPAHRREVNRFLRQAGRTIHAIELNGLRHVRENRDAAQLARETGHLVLSGGDRHGLEPNANINLTSAASFTEFVEEIRVDGVSHVHFMPQYQDRWEQRILRSTLNAVTDFPEFMPGWQRWDERAFHPDQDGVMRSFAELWPKGHAPRLLQTAIHLVRLSGVRGLSAPLSLAFPGVNRLEHELGAGMEWV